MRVIKKIKATWNAVLADGRARANKYLDARPHRSFKPTPKYRYKKGKKVIGPWPLVKGVFALIWKEKRILIGLMLLSAFFFFVFVGSIPILTFADLRRSINEIFNGDVGQVGAAWTLFNAAVTGSLNTTMSPLQQFLAGLITVLFWLTYVWALRRLLADKPERVTIRDALYSSGTPLLSSVLVFLAAVVQLLPAALGSFGIALVTSGQWLNGVEAMMFCVAAGLLCLMSIYWVVSSLIALIIVTIPGMYPWRALAAASVFVIGQRWAIALRVVLLVVILYVVWAVILIPTLLLDNWLKFDYLPIIPVVAQLLGAFTVLFASVYMYKLYRSML